MAKRRRYPLLRVFVNGRVIGRLRKETTGAIDFTYDPEWLAWESAFPVSLSLPLREDKYIGAPVAAVFDNLLPDNDQIRRRIAEKVGAKGDDPYSLLATIGGDCVGALQFLPEGVDPTPLGIIDGEAVSDEEIGRIINDLGAAPLGIEEDDDFRISIAGAQEKTALLWHGGHWIKPRGTTPTTHIFKPQIGQLPNGIDLSNSVENEFFCLRLAANIGLDAADVEMATFGERRVLIVRRFDRELTRDGRLLRQPQEDFCQALSIPWARKYEREGGPGILTGMDLLAASDEPTLDRLAYFKTMIFFWLLGATDGHGKNFSIFIYPSGGARLTPLYDVLSAQPSVDAHQITRNKFKLAMAVGTNRRYGVDDIVPRHFIQSGDACGLPRSTVVGLFAELLADSPEAIDVTVADLPPGFPTALSDSIVRGYRDRLAQIADFVAEELGEADADDSVDQWRS